MPYLLDSFEQFIRFIIEFPAQFWAFLVYLNIPIPLGIIGTWRWSIWGMRRLIGLWYRAEEPRGYWADTAIITPVYNEDPELFRAALRSWAANRPKEIIAVIDHTDSRCMVQFQEFKAEIAGQPIELKMLVTMTPGKRPALVDGILAATSDIVFLVDSDTIWEPDVLRKALAPFHDPAVGEVTVRQRVWQPHTTAQRIFDVYLDIHYIDEIRFLTAFGDAVTCLSGRTAAYRRAVALTALDDLMGETFWGRRVISGDDKALTLAVQSRGWKVRYQDNTCVYTPGATVMKDFLKQRLRWARNSWRANLKALGSRWVWRKPFLAFHLFDRLLQPLITLIAPLYLGIAIYHQNWPAVLLLLSWWTVSRTVKIWPHLRRDWTNIRVLPWYITFSYWSAVTKIYAFFTMNQQGWITRWSRGGKSSAWGQWLQAAPSYAATSITVALVAFLVNLLHEVPATTVVPAFLPSQSISEQRTADKQIEGRVDLAKAELPSEPHDAPATTAQLCVLAGEASGSCTTYPIRTTSVASAGQWGEATTGLLHTVRRRVWQLFPVNVNGQEARQPIFGIEAAQFTATPPSPRTPTTNLLCVMSNNKEQHCQSYTIQ